MNTLTGVLVGMHFRPPAKLVLETLASGANLTLEAEPTNEWDEWAVRVSCSPKDIPSSQYIKLRDELPGYGMDLAELLAMPSVWLGYLAASKNKALKNRPDLVSNQVFVLAQEQVSWQDCSITLGFDSNGQPLVILVAP